MPAPKTETGRAKARAALSRYRILAYITGVMLLVLCVEMLLNYVILGQDHQVMKYLSWIPFTHGFIYMVYLVMVGDLWSRMRWGGKELVIMVLGGVVPIMSFLVEKKVHVQALAELAAAELDAAASGETAKVS